MKKKKKLNKKRCIITFLILVLIIIISVTMGKGKKEPELSILLNNELIQMKNDVIFEEDIIYFSKEDIKNIFDDTIYYNEAEKELITTYNTHVALLKVDEKYGLINDENVELDGKLKEKNKTVYIPFNDLQTVYDIDLSYSSKTNRIIMDSTQVKKVEATLLKKTKVKSKKNIFGKRLEKLIIGDKVTILEEDGNYKKIKTAAGNIGYVKSKKLSSEIVIREDVKKDKREINAYTNYSNISGVYENFQVDESKLNVVLPTFFYIDAENKILDKTTSTTATYSVYKNWADNNKLEILPTLNSNENVSKSLLSYSQRSQVINSLLEQIKEHNYIGINIDFDSIDDINSFYRFIVEIVPRFKNENLMVTVRLNKNIDKKRIQNIVDYIIEV